MASGVVHNKDATLVNVTVVPVVAAVYFLLTGDLLGLIDLTILTVLSVYLVSPDVDQPLPNKAQYQLIKVTPYIGYINAWFWHAYAEIFKHRSFFSHYPILGTLIRIAYIIIKINITIALIMIFEVGITVFGVPLVVTGFFLPILSWKLLFLIPLFINDYIHWERDERDIYSFKDSLDIW